MYPVLLIAIGVAVLLLGKRLAVLGAAVGALLGVGLLRLFASEGDPLLQFAVVGLLALVGFFVAGFAKGLIDIVILVLGAIGGAAIVLGFIGLFTESFELWAWLLAVVGGVVGFILMRRSRKGSKDWGIIILAGLIGALLVTRGLAIWLPALQGAIGTLIVLVLAGGSIAFQGGYLGRRKAAAKAPATAAATPAAKSAATPAPAPAPAPTPSSQPANDTPSTPPSTE